MHVLQFCQRTQERIKRGFVLLKQLFHGTVLICCSVRGDIVYSKILVSGQDALEFNSALNLLVLQTIDMNSSLSVQILLIYVEIDKCGNYKGFDKLS